MLSKYQSNYLWTTSWFSLFGFLYGLYNRRQIAIFPGLIFITSINHWRNPIRGSWRQRIDIITVITCIYLQRSFGMNLEYYQLYCKIVTLGLSFYPLALYFSRRNEVWKSVISHSAIHIVGNLANIVLYSSKQTV
jgi:hypothetical protein